ncbi:AraC family transcriptional regulator [Paenibacillus sp. J5C_2022]|uniref:helix-turn-helix domain-containing protein n=1 Tax=Paenibacillus sp. J5C2022 TaxID=2977129 RepID=UPI0021D29851|nr:AraC family transcriptional regulator [Paenibacillus sp. J5C2022]MCU6712471.1 AraC family transcriptional regulator [Paenibacillus sp. J5C2022]
MRIRKCGMYPVASRQDAEPEKGGIHASFEMLYLFEGQFKLEWLGMTYSSAEPCLFLIPSYTPHTLNGLSQSFKYFYIEIDTDSDERIPSLPFIMNWNEIQGRSGGNMPEVQLVLSSVKLLSELVALNPELEDDTLHELAITDIKKIFLLINYILTPQRSRLEKGQASHQATINALMRYLESHYTDMSTLPTLSRIVHLSESHLIRVFKKHTGKTPFRYLDDLRLHAATSYLENTRLAIGEIADLTGFKSIHFFSRHFKRRFKVSPSVWRERHSQAIE